MLHVCTWLRIHARGAQPGAFEFQTVVVLLLCGLKSSRLCFSPWQQCGLQAAKRGQQYVPTQIGNISNFGVSYRQYLGIAYIREFEPG